MAGTTSAQHAACGARLAQLLTGFGMVLFTRDDLALDINGGELQLPPELTQIFFAARDRGPPTKKEMSDWDPTHPMTLTPQPPLEESAEEPWEPTTEFVSVVNEDLYADQSGGPVRR